MTKHHRLWFALALAGCGSDADTICDKLDECILLRTSTKECAEQFDTVYKENERQECAECIDEKSCAAISRGDCRDACPGLGDQ